MLLTKPIGICGLVASFVLALTTCLYPLEKMVKDFVAQNIVADMISLPRGVVLQSDQHSKLVPVPVQPFALSSHEVTQFEFEALSGFNPSKFWWQPNAPVENVSQGEVERFISQLALLTNRRHFRLPTPLEWEYANTRATPSPTGQSAPVPPTSTRAVKAGMPNAFGLYDLTGNVAEMCKDDESELSPCMGQSYADNRDVADDTRYLKGKLARNHQVGFRLAGDISDEQRSHLTRTDEEIELEAADLYLLKGLKTEAASRYAKVITPESLNSSRLSAIDVSRAIALAEVLQMQKLNDRAKALYSSIIAVLDRLPQNDPAARLPLQRAVTDSLLSHENEKFRPLAQSSLSATLELLKRTQSDRSADFIKYTFWLGKIDYSLREKDQAKQCFSNAIALADMLIDKSPVTAYVTSAQSYLTRIALEEQNESQTECVRQWRELYDRATNTEDDASAIEAYEASMEVARRGGLIKEMSLSTAGLRKLKDSGVRFSVSY